jgi:monofunctional glycosyltransferase
VAAPTPPAEPVAAAADAAPAPPEAQGSAPAPARPSPALWPPRVSAALALSPPTPRLALAPPAPRAEHANARGAPTPATAHAAAEAHRAPASTPVTTAEVPAAAARDAAAAKPQALADAGAARSGEPQPLARGSGVGRPGPRYANPTWPSATRAEAHAPPLARREQPAEPTPGRAADTRARPVEASPARGAAAERLRGPLPVPLFPPRRVDEPAAPAADLPIWQETPPPRPGPPAVTRTPAAGRPRDLHLVLGRILKLSALGALGFVLLLAGLIVLYRWVNPPTSMLMLGQRLGGTSITQHWVSLEHIASNLQLAVIASEDGRFCRHHGVDWEELESAIDQSVDGVARGGSTIAMQTVKNLFLWPAKSYLRKAMEIPLAYAVDTTWSKRRLLEIYLNIAEWGPGVFGAEAAARYHFRKPASLLSAREAALLAVSLPNPFERRAGAPGPGTQRLAANLMLRMRTAPGMARCVRSGSGL